MVSDEEKKILVDSGIRLRQLNQNFRVAVNETNLKLFEQHRIESMVFESLSGFNLCLIFMDEI